MIPSAVLADNANRSFTEVSDPADIGVCTPLSNYGVVYVVMGSRKLRHWVPIPGTPRSWLKRKRDDERMAHEDRLLSIRRGGKTVTSTTRIITLPAQAPQILQTSKKMVRDRFAPG